MGIRDSFIEIPVRQSRYPNDDKAIPNDPKRLTLANGARDASTTLMNRAVALSPPLFSSSWASLQPSWPWSAIDHASCMVRHRPCTTLLSAQDDCGESNDKPKDTGNSGHPK